MFTNWFPNGIFPAKRRTPNLQSRINILMDSSKGASKSSSPTLQSLQRSQKHQVKRLSSVYEANIASFNDTTITSVGGSCMRKAVSEKLLAPINEATEEQVVPLDNILSKSLPDLSAQNYLAKLIEMDAQFILKMENLITKYVKQFALIPGRCDNDELNEQRVHSVFPIERIYHFHKFKFHPTLKDCKSLSAFASNISVMCKNGSFNPYMIYAMDEQDSEYRRNVCYKTFMDTVVDKTGVLYDFDPINQLQRYQILISEILCCLKNTKAPCEVIDYVTSAKSNWMVMLNKVYTMQSLQK